VRLHLLTTGWADIDVAAFMPMEPERGSVYSSPMGAFLITGPVTALIDTGPAPEHIDDPTYRTGGPEMVVHMRPEDHIVARLAQLDVHPGDVELVITTHFDCDHCGGHRFFPDARHVVQRAQLEFATEHPERCPHGDWAAHGIDYELLDGDAEVAPGVSAIATPGHAPGHQSVVVDLPETGPVIVAGDAAVTETMLEHERVTGTHDPGASVASIRRLKGLRDELGATVIVAHDAEAWRARYRVAPEAWYS